MKRVLENNDKNTVLRYLCLKSEIPEGKSKSFSISDEKGLGEDIAVFNINGKYHAISNTCVHKGGPSKSRESKRRCGNVSLAWMEI